MPLQVSFVMPLQVSFIMPLHVSFVMPLQVSFIMPLQVSFVMPLQVSFIMPLQVSFIMPLQLSFIMPLQVSFIMPLQVSFIMPIISLSFFSALTCGVYYATVLLIDAFHLETLLLQGLVLVPCTPLPYVWLSCPAPRASLASLASLCESWGSGMAEVSCRGLC